MLRTMEAWRQLCDGRKGVLLEALSRMHGSASGESTALSRRIAELYARILDKAQSCLGDDRPGMLVRAPARVNLMGMHIDHRGGAINPIALLETVAFVAPRDDDQMVLDNVEEIYPHREFAISDELPAEKVSDWEAWTRAQYAKRAEAGTAGDWSDYVRAAVTYYQDRRKTADGELEVKLPGLNMIFGSVVPPAAGLSSSSAMVVSTLVASLMLNEEWEKTPVEELIDWCGDAEWYVGTRGGKGDHASILCGKPGEILHLEFFPTRISSYTLSEGNVIVLANSRVEAKKSAGARDFFNQRIAGYVIGEHCLKSIAPDLLGKAPNLASCTPRRAGYPETDLYKILKDVPECMTRKEALEKLPDSREALERIFDSHAEPENGYDVRQITLFGLAEVERSDRCPEVLASGNVEAFGELMNLSHDGDRVVRHTIGEDGSPADKQTVDNSVSTDQLDRWASDATPLWRIPGGYDAAVEETDLLADLALSVPGVWGARLIGAGRGGCVGILCREEAVETVLQRFRDHYYGPRGLPEDSAFVVSPCAGAGKLSL